MYYGGASVTELEQFIMTLTLLCIPHSVKTDDRHGDTVVWTASCSFSFGNKTGKFRLVHGMDSDGASVVATRLSSDAEVEAIAEPDAPTPVVTIEEFYNTLIQITPTSGSPVPTYVAVCLATSFGFDLVRLQERLDLYAADNSLVSPPSLSPVSVVNTTVDLVLSDPKMAAAVKANTGPARSTEGVAYARYKKAQKYGIQIVILGKDV